jgi:hypothetical protein
MGFSEYGRLRGNKCNPLVPGALAGESVLGGATWELHPDKFSLQLKCFCKVHQLKTQTQSSCVSRCSPHMLHPCVTVREPHGSPDKEGAEPGWTSTSPTKPRLAPTRPDWAKAPPRVLQLVALTCRALEDNV